MFKNALIYRITEWHPSALDQIDERLAKARFAECGATQPESFGWVEPRGQQHGSLAESIGGQLVLRLATETKAVPAAVVKRRLEEQMARIEAETGRKPRGKHKKELKEAIVHELLPRAFPKRGGTWVWLDPKAGWLVIDASSAKKADRVTTLLVELLGGALKLAPLNTELAPATAMAAWLSEKEAPAGFTIDRDCELKAAEGEKPAVRYARHTLEIDEVAEHIRQGKRPTQLALTWRGRVSFVLTEALVLKKVKLLDVVLEQRGEGGEDFDADVALFTGEFGALMPDLLAALGGELNQDERLAA
jgi:recombination associated protein RdgC